MRHWLVPTCLGLFMVIGLTTLHSLTPELLNKQIGFWVIGWVIYFLTARVPFYHWLKMSRASLVGLIILLIVVLFVAETRDTARWFHIWGFSLQPSQLALPVLSLFSASLIASSHLKYASRLWKYLAILALPLFLILIEPDLGTVIVTLATLSLSLIICGLNGKIIRQLAWIGLVTMGFGWLILQPYQKARLTSFLDSNSTSSSSNYNATQALISIGSGGLMGRGVGLGSQSQLKFLPEKQTDFIFSAIAEETGLVGAGLLLMIYLSLIWFLLSEAKSLPLPGQVISISLGVWLALQSSINVGMNLGLLPITGLTLPFVSYGGSSLLSSLWWLGLAQSASAEGVHQPQLHIS
ncbi:MAG: FtsW/RodA/SpoVE family cell cycle protein [Patescibacteria group bacterium]